MNPRGSVSQQSCESATLGFIFALGGASRREEKEERVGVNVSLYVKNNKLKSPGVLVARQGGLLPPPQGGDGRSSVCEGVGVGVAADKGENFVV